MEKLPFSRSDPIVIGCIASHFIYKDYPKFHNHDFYEVVFCYQGSYYHTINGYKYEMRIFEGAFLLPDDCHNLVQNSKTAAHLNISFERGFFESVINNYSPNLLNALTNKNLIRITVNETQMSKLIEYTTLLKQDDNIIKDRFLIENVIATTVLNLVVEQQALIINNKPKWLIDLIDKMNRQENINWTVKDVLREASYSHSHLTRKFKTLLGCTIIEYLTKIKMSAAIEYLTHSEKSISEISIILGYDSVSHLNHIFKQRTGLSPLQYRKNYRNRIKNPEQE